MWIGHLTGWFEFVSSGAHNHAHRQMIQLATVQLKGNLMHPRRSHTLLHDSLWHHVGVWHTHSTKDNRNSHDVGFSPVSTLHLFMYIYRFKAVTYIPSNFILMSKDYTLIPCLEIGTS